MKTVSILAFSLLLSFSLHAQIQAGQTGNMDITPLGIELQLLSNPPGTFEQLSDSVDVTGDGIYDLAFEITLSNVPDFGGSTADVRVLNDSVEIMTTGYHATRLSLGQDILPDSTWTNDLNWPLAAQFIGFAGATEYGQWLVEHSGYMAFRVIQPADTLYGWFDVYAQATYDSVRVRVGSFALETIINGTEEPPVHAFALFPNPATDHITLQWDAEQVGQPELFVYDAQGILRATPALAVTGPGAGELDISHLSPGPYFIRIRLGGSGWYGVEKVVVVR